MPELDVAAELAFTGPQRELIEARKSTYVEACPGAGKTQAIVQRFIDRPVRHPRKGTALISFTNAAIDEARRRCVARPELLEVPNFVGTIDSFINRFLVAPTFLARRKIAPSFRDSWATVPHSQVAVNGVQLRAELDAFEIDGRTAKLRPDRLPYEMRGTARGLTDAQTQALEAQALGKWTAYVQRGVLSASAARVALREYLDGEQRRTQLGKLLKDRFAEVIVDEVQDCSSDDLLLHELLLDNDVCLIAVGDPDQSIYSFRSDEPADVAKFLSKLTPGTRLDGNFRSSPAVCAAVDSLRADARTDRPVGPTKAVTHPIVLVSYRQRPGLSAKFRSIATRFDLDPEQVVVIAHAADHARVAAGHGSGLNTGTNRLVQMAHDVDVITGSTSTPRERVDAVRDFERRIRELGTEDVVMLDHEHYLQSVGLNLTGYREACLRIAAAAPAPFDEPPSVFRAALAEMRDSQTLLRWSAAPLRRPADDIWPSQGRPTDADSLEHSTVHGLKGLQAPVVALVLPQTRVDSDGVQQWMSSTPGEERRVLYVGASRAQKLLILATHETVHQAVVDRLAEDGVPYEIDDA